MMDHLLLSPEQQTLIYCHLACVSFSEILKMAKQLSNFISLSMFLMLMESSHPLSCNVYKMFAEDCITFASFFYSYWDILELLFKLGITEILD